jgi:hypothetical protein
MANPQRPRAQGPNGIGSFRKRLWINKPIGIMYEKTTAVVVMPRIAASAVTDPILIRERREIVKQTSPMARKGT